MLYQLVRIPYTVSSYNSFVKFDGNFDSSKYVIGRHYPADNIKEPSLIVLPVQIMIKNITYDAHKRYAKRIWTL